MGSLLSLSLATIKIVAPIDGIINKTFEINHAFSIESDNRIELFIHFSINIIELKGEGFCRIYEEDQRVKVML